MSDNAIHNVQEVKLAKQSALQQWLEIWFSSNLASFLTVHLDSLKINTVFLAHS
jgi:hypothetical protein